MSKKSAPGIVVGMGVIGANLKHDPDMFVSSDAGYSWHQVGKALISVGLVFLPCMANFLWRMTNGGSLLIMNDLSPIQRHSLKMHVTF